MVRQLKHSKAEVGSSSSRSRKRRRKIREKENDLLFFFSQELIMALPNEVEESLPIDPCLRLSPATSSRDDSFPYCGRKLFLSLSYLFRSFLFPLSFYFPFLLFFSAHTNLLVRIALDPDLLKLDWMTIDDDDDDAIALPLLCV